MIFPLDINLGVITLPIHLVTDLLAFYIGYKYYAYLRAKSGDHLSTDRRFTIIIGAAVGALLGSRLLAALEDWQQFIAPASLLYYYANKTIVGGIIGGIIGVEVTKKIIKERVATGDIFTLPLMVGLIIGRVGCLLMGVADGTVGNPSSLPWAFDQGDGIARHPTSLYEIIFLIIMFFILKKLSTGVPLKPGIIFRLFIASYLLFRFLIEFIKPVEPILLGLSAIQVASLIFALYYLYALIFVYKYRPFRRLNV